MRAALVYVLITSAVWALPGTGQGLAQENVALPKKIDNVKFRHLPRSSDPLKTIAPAVPAPSAFRFSNLPQQPAVRPGMTKQIESLESAFSKAYDASFIVKPSDHKPKLNNELHLAPPKVQSPAKAPTLFPPTNTRNLPSTSIIGVKELPSINPPNDQGDERLNVLPPLRNSEFGGKIAGNPADSRPPTSKKPAIRTDDDNSFSAPLLIDNLANDKGSVNDAKFPALPEASRVTDADELQFTEGKPDSPFKSAGFANKKPAFEPAVPANSLSALTTSNPFWWKSLIQRPLHPENKTESTSTHTLVYDALKNSPRIQAISQEPLIRELQISEAESEFDPAFFVRSQFDDRVDPVGNTLTTGGAPFLEDHIWSGETGVRRKLATGAQVEFGQRVGFQNSNSRFFVPQDQGTATLALNVSQPLLRGRGQYYNRSQILIAQSAGGVAWETFQSQLQDEIQSVVKAYWQLYYERSIFLQKRRNVARGEAVLKLLQGRENFDAMPVQIARARSAVFSRRAELQNAFRDIKNAETEIRRLVSDRDWRASQSIELLPAEPVDLGGHEMPLETIVELALQNRPEIRETIQRSKIAAIEHNVSTNELLPELTFLFNTYVSALDGGSGVERALTGQFSNTPGYSVGVEFEVPIHNRAARSRQAQRDLRKSKIKAELEQMIQTVIAEAQVADRRRSAARETMAAAESAIVAARYELVQNQKRWEAFGLVEGDLVDGQTPTTILDQLLDSQDRLAQAELVYTQAEVDLKIANIELQRAMGTLLQHQNVTHEKACDDGKPSLILDQAMEN